MVEEVTLTWLATTGGLSILIMTILGLVVKPLVRASKGEEWKWAGPVVNIAAFLLGIVLGPVVFGLVEAWEGVPLFLGAVTGVFSAASAVGFYEAARARTV